MRRVLMSILMVTVILGLLVSGISCTKTITEKVYVTVTPKVTATPSPKPIATPTPQPTKSNTEQIWAMLDQYLSFTSVLCGMTNEGKDTQLLERLIQKDKGGRTLDYKDMEIGCVKMNTAYRGTSYGLPKIQENIAICRVTFRPYEGPESVWDIMLSYEPGANEYPGQLPGDWVIRSVTKVY